MKKVLFIESSPRGDKSHTTTLASSLISDLRAQDSVWDVDHLDLWNETFPPMNGPAVTAKYAILTGRALDAEEQKAWSAIAACMDRFRAADLVLLAAPMWNFGIPYVLKHFIDVITQPGLVFSWTPEDGYTSLLPPRRAVIITSSAGDYSPGSKNVTHDYLLPYLTDWLTIYMGCQVDSIAVAPTVADPESLAATVQEARNAARELVRQLA